MVKLRLIALTDTHRDIRALKYSRQLLEENRPDLFVHAGDNYQDFLWLQERTGIPGHGVAGNCDYANHDVPEELIFDFGGTKILLCHGHRYNVKLSCQNLILRAQELEANAVIFGHTHTALVRWEQDILLFNPGSLHQPRSQSTYSYGLLTASSEGLSPKIEAADKSKINSKKARLKMWF